MTKRNWVVTVIAGTVILWAGFVYIAAQVYPFDTSGEGYRGND